MKRILDKLLQENHEESYQSVEAVLEDLHRQPPPPPPVPLWMKCDRIYESLLHPSTGNEYRPKSGIYLQSVNNYLFLWDSRLGCASNWAGKMPTPQVILYFSELKTAIFIS